MKYSKALFLPYLILPEKTTKSEENETIPQIKTLAREVQHQVELKTKKEYTLFKALNTWEISDQKGP